jgi:hypothetical protein
MPSLVVSEWSWLGRLFWALFCWRCVGPVSTNPGNHCIFLLGAFHFRFRFRYWQTGRLAVICTLYVVEMDT